MALNVRLCADVPLKEPTHTHSQRSSTYDKLTWLCGTV